MGRWAFGWLILCIRCVCSRITRSRLSGQWEERSRTLRRKPCKSPSAKFAGPPTGTPGPSAQHPTGQGWRMGMQIPFRSVGQSESSNRTQAGSPSLVGEDCGRYCPGSTTCGNPPRIPARPKALTTTPSTPYYPRRGGMFRCPPADRSPSDRYLVMHCDQRMGKVLSCCSSSTSGHPRIFGSEVADAGWARVRGVAGMGAQPFGEVFPWARERALLMRTDLRDRTMRERVQQKRRTGPRKGRLTHCI